MNRTQQTYQSKSASSPKEAEKPEFPAARYFQIHFEHLHAQLEETRQSVRDLQQQVQELNGRLVLGLDFKLPETKE